MFFSPFSDFEHKSETFPHSRGKKLAGLKKITFYVSIWSFCGKNCLKKSTFSPTFEIWTNFFCTLFEKNPLGSVKLISMPSAKFLNKNHRFFEETVFFPSFSDIQRKFPYLPERNILAGLSKMHNRCPKENLEEKNSIKNVFFFYKFWLLSEKWSANLSFFFGEDVKAPLYVFLWTIWRRRIFSGKSHSVITCVQWVMIFHPFVVIFSTDLSKLNFTFPKEYHLKKSVFSKNSCFLIATFGLWTKHLRLLSKLFWQRPPTSDLRFHGNILRN